MATTFTIPASTLQPGPFSSTFTNISSTATLLDLELDISDPTNNCSLTVAFQVSYDGGSTWRAGGGGGSPVPIVNGSVFVDGPSGLLPLSVGFDTLQPTNQRQIKVNGNVSGSALILRQSTLVVS